MGRFDSAPRRVPLLTVRRERGRWLSAVLIVAAIGATTVIVRVWPVRTRPVTRVAAPVPARPLQVLEAPVAPASATASRLVVWAPAPPAPPDRPTAPAPLSPSQPEPPRAAANDHVVVRLVSRSAEREPLEPLTSGHIPVGVMGAPALAGTPTSDVPPHSSPGLVELPAVAVTRAMAVAGRGIKTGLRATGAVFKAAF